MRGVLARFGTMDEQQGDVSFPSLQTIFNVAFRHDSQRRVSTLYGHQLRPLSGAKA